MEKLTKALMTDETGQAIVGKLIALSGQMRELAMATRGSAILFESESDISVLGDGGYLTVYVGTTNPLVVSGWTGDNSLVTGHLYYLMKSGTAVASRDLGEYGGSAVTDTTLGLPNVPADSETVGLKLALKANTNDVDANIGDLSQLTTTAKNNLVSAINEAAQTGSGEISYIEKTIGENFVAAQQAFSNVTWKGGYFNPTTGATAGNSQYRYTDEYFDISILAAVKSVYLNTRNIACVVFYDASKEVVSTINQTTNGGDIVTSITVPENAIYFRICQPTANTDPFPLSLYVAGDLFAKAETDLPVDIESVLTAQGGITINGSLSTHADWKVTDFVKVSPGMLLKYLGCGNIGSNTTLCPIAFYDSGKKPVLVIKPTESKFVYMYNKGWLDASASGMSINFGFTLVPPAARYCRVSGYRLLQPILEVATAEPWAGKKCVFFGDSITIGVSTSEKYCNFLAMSRGITVANYGVNGNNLVDHGMSRVTAFVTDYADNPADAFIFAYGTNDWGDGKPLGEWYTTDFNGVRTLTTDTTTFRGAWVQILTYLKTNFDGKKIILMTPIHRGAGSYASDLTRNNAGLYLEDYVKIIKEAGEIFSIDVIDLYSESGLTPDINPDTAYFTGNDRLHPNAEGHKQMAKVISAKMGDMTI